MSITSCITYRGIVASSVANRIAAFFVIERWWIYQLFKLICYTLKFLISSTKNNYKTKHDSRCGRWGEGQLGV